MVEGRYSDMLQLLSDLHLDVQTQISIWKNNIQIPPALLFQAWFTLKPIRKLVFEF